MGVNNQRPPAPIQTPQHIPEKVENLAAEHGLPTNPWIMWYNGVDSFLAAAGAAIGTIINVTLNGIAVLYGAGIQAKQLLSDFLGDHLSSKMFGASGLTRNLLDGGMTSGSPILHSVTGAFVADDAGKIAVVQGAGAAGAPLVTTILSLIDSTHVNLSVNAGTTVTAADAYIGADDTDGLLSMSIPLGGDGSGIERLIPTGIYLVRPGDYLIPNPQSGILEGQGTRFNTRITSADPTDVAPVLTLGDGTFEPHSFTLTSLTIDSNHTPAGVALYLNRTNLMDIRDVIVQNIATGGIGISTPSVAHLFGEMIFDHVGVLGEDGGVPSGSVGAVFYATGNVTLEGCNFEQLDTGVIFIGSSQVKFTFTGGHIERIGGYAFIITNAQPFIDADCNVGAVWLDNGVVNGYINLTNTSGLWTVGGVVDNGFGNRIRKTSSRLFNSTKASFAAGFSFEGDEWLSVSGLVDDPTFLAGVATWTPTNGTMASGSVSMPGAKAGRSLQLTATSANAFVERTFTAAANTDYLLQVGIMTQNADVYRLVIANSGGTVWDSGNFSYGYASGDFQAFKVIRKSIPVTADTVFKVRLYAVTSGQVTAFSLLLISKSQIQMNGNYTSTGTGLTTSGSGPTFTLIQNTTTGSVFSFKVVTSKNRSFARAVVTVPAGVSGFIGIGGDSNTATAGPMIPLIPNATLEYTIPLSAYPTSSIVDFFSPTGGGSIQIGDLGVYEIEDLKDAPFVMQRAYTGVPNSLNLTGGRLWLGGNFESNWQAAASAGNGFKRATFGDNIRWDEAGGNWVVTDNGSGDWAMLILANSGVIQFASEIGLSLPTTRTDAQINAAVQWQLSSGVVTQLKGGASYNSNVRAGSPVGVLSGGKGDTCSDITNGDFYVNSSGGTGGWVKLIGSASAGITQLTGDVTAGPGSGSQVATLAASGVAAATYGDATHVPQIAVDAKGRITSASDVLITGGFPTGAWTSYTPSSSNITSASYDAAYLQIGKVIFFRVKVSGTSNGSAPTLTLPPISPVTTNQTFAVAINNGGGPNAAGVLNGLSGTTMTLGFYNGGAFAAASIFIIVQGVYESS